MISVRPMLWSFPFQVSIPHGLIVSPPNHFTIFCTQSTFRRWGGGGSPRDPPPPAQAALPPPPPPLQLLWRTPPPPQKNTHSRNKPRLNEQRAMETQRQTSAVHSSGVTPPQSTACGKAE